MKTEQLQSQLDAEKEVKRLLYINSENVINLSIQLRIADALETIIKLLKKD